MVEPLLMTALENAFDIGKRLLEEAGYTKKYNGAACVKYLEAARTAIAGLEDELDEILIEAKQVSLYGWESGEKKADLHKRIADYLHRDRLRKILHESLEGIRACHEALVADANSFWQGERSQQQKQEAVDHLVKLLGEQDEYLKSLSHQMTFGEVNYTGPSALNLSELLDLEALLENVGTSKEQITTLVEEIQNERERRGLPLVAHGKGVIQELTVAFRLAQREAT
jgi:hypothetical protein